MPAAPSVKPSTPVSAIASMAPISNITPVQSGPYTKAQFQSTMEGSRTIKSVKEIENLLRDYPAALELYRTGKYKVKVKCDADVERVILVEKRISKVAANNTSVASTVTNDNQENNQTVPDTSISTEQDKEFDEYQQQRQSRSRTHSRDRVAPTVTTNSTNLVHTTMSSIRITSNTQPKVGHHRTPSKERDVSLTPQQNQEGHPTENKQQQQQQPQQQQGKHANREYPKMMVPFVPNGTNPFNVWSQQQKRNQQAYLSNPLLQQQQQQQQQQRANLNRASTLAPQSNPLLRPPYYYGPRPNVPVAYPQQPSMYQIPSIRARGTSTLYSTNNFPTSSSSRSALNNSVLPPSFRTFHANQQVVPSFHPMYRPQVPFPVTHPWLNMANEPIGVMGDKNNSVRMMQQNGARTRAHSVDTRARGNPAQVMMRPMHGQQQSVMNVEQHRVQRTNNVAHPVDQGKEQNAKETTGVPNHEKLTVRQLNENFMQAAPSGRVPFSALPGIIQRFGIVLTENDVISAGTELGYNTNEPISARRFVHILVKLGKITKSTQQQQQQRPTGSPTILPEDREVTDIMTQRKATTTNDVQTSNQTNQWH